MAKKKPLPELSFFEGRTNYLEAQDKDRDDMFEGIDTMINLEWELPESLKGLTWIFTQIETIFRQVIAASIRILVDVKPKITIVPTDPSQGSRDVADEHEKGLAWLLSAASRRRRSTIVEDIVESSARYAEVTQQVMFIPEQMKNVKASGGNEKRYKALQRRGPYIVITHNPRNVHARYSDVGVEEVVLVMEIDPHDVVDLYGDKAKELQAYIETYTGDVLTAVLYDYVSYDFRAVWVTLGPSAGKAGSPGTGGETFEIAREAWRWPFLPWVARIGGTSLEHDSDKIRRPMLSDAWHANSYETMNRVKTLRYSEMLKFAATPKKYFQSGGRTSPEVTSVDGDLYQHIDEDEAIGDMNPPLPDPGMASLHQELRLDAQRSTLSEVLFGGEVPAGAAFATINLVTHSALAVLKPTRLLAQNAMADLLELMLLWSHYTKTDVSGYGQEVDVDEGKEYLIEWKEIVPDNLYITVDLTADVPTDRQARMMAATQGVQAGLMTRARGREEIGIVNAKEEEERIVEEQLFDNLMQMDMENERFMNSMAIRQELKNEVMQEVQAEMQAQQQAQQGPQSGPPGQPVTGLGGQIPGPGQGGANPGGPPGMPPTGIPEEAAPSLGGPVPAELNPNATRELQTGMTAGGEEVAEV